MRNLTITNLAVDEIRPNPRNPRTHSAKQVSQIAASIREFGFTNPILIDETDEIIAGHGRLEGARAVGLAEVPCIRLEGLTNAQKKALVIADNKLAINAGWDLEILEEQMLELIDEGLDLEITGFEVPEINLILQNTWDAAETDPQDENIPAVLANVPPVARPGDVWLLGRHRLFCGNSLEAESYRRLLEVERAAMVFTDPPYNVPIDGHVCGSGKVKHREFAMASGEMTEAAFVDFLKTAAERLVEYSAEGSIHFLCMDWRHLYELLSACRGTYSEFKNLCVWVKDNGGMGSLYRSQHELVAVFKAGKGPHINNVELGRHGRYRTNVWKYPGINSFGKGRMSDLKAHPTVKPVAMVADAILDCSKPGDLVLDPFAGSGTIFLAAERAGRRGAGIEIDPHYVDVAARRFEQETGEAAVLEASGEVFSSVAETRAKEGME
jgi:DNA modification methylase